MNWPSATIGGGVTWRGELFAAMLVAVAVAASACGSSESADSSSGQEEQGSSEETTTSAIEAVQVAYKTTTEAKTAKIDFDSTISGLPAGADASGQAKAMTFRMSGQGVADFENKAVNMTMRTPMGELEMRQIGSTIYEKLPDRLVSQTPGQKPWMKMDLDAMMREQFGASYSELQGNAPTDPSEQLGYLQGASDSVEEVGTEEVRGAPATHYRADVDLEKAAEQQGAQQNAQVRQAYDKAEQQLGARTLPMDVWLDDKGRVVRLEMNMPVPIPADPSSTQGGGGSGQGQVAITEELYDFGAPVNVEPPPEDQTGDFNELASARRGSS